MSANFKLIWEALLNAYDAGWDLVLINLLWFVLSLPIITLPATMAGLVYYTHELAHGESMSWKDFFIGMKKYFWPSMRCLLLNLVIIFIMIFYYEYFGALNNNFSPIVMGLIYGLAFIYLLFTPFIFPLMVEQKKPSLRIALRNSLVMWLKWPGVSILVIIIFYALVIASSYILLPWILLSGSLCAFLLSYVVMRKAEESLKLEQSKEAN